MSDQTLLEEVPAIPVARAVEVGPGARRGAWRRWLSTALFAVVLGCFALPFASTSCTLPGGYGRGAQGTSTVYRGVDLAFDAVPAVTPSDRPPRPGSLPDDGRLGVQPLLLLALLAAAAGAALAARFRPVPTLVVAALTAALLVLGQLVAAGAIAANVGGAEPLPAGKSQADYVGTGPGVLAALLLLLVLLAVNGTVAVWQARRPRAPA